MRPGSPAVSDFEFHNQALARPLGQGCPLPVGVAEPVGQVGQLHAPHPAHRPSVPVALDLNPLVISVGALHTADGRATSSARNRFAIAARRPAEISRKRSSE